MRARLLGDFKSGRGLASPSLIVVWLALGAGLIWLQWNMSFAGIESYSGNVKTVSTDPQFGTHVTIDSSSIDFFFDSLGFAQLPDIRVGDHIEMLTEPLPQGYGIAEAVAVDSQRGAWVSTIYGRDIAGFTPQTWALHEVLRWSALALGVLIALFGAASLVRWIPSTQARAQNGRGSAIAPASVSESPGAATELDAQPPPLVHDTPVASAPPSVPSSDRADLGVWVGGVTVTALPFLEVVGVFSAFGSCASYGFNDGLLIAITIALFAGGISTLILAASSATGSPRRAVARRLGMVAVVMAVASVPVNAFLVLLSGFCAFG